MHTTERSRPTEHKREHISPWLIAGRVIFTFALIACIVFIFSNSMEVGTASTGTSGKVLAWMRLGLRKMGLGEIADHLTMYFVRKLAHFCEYALEGFLLMLCMRVYSRRPLLHISVPMLGGLLTALTDETIQLFSEGRSSQVTDVWLDFVGVLSGIFAAVVLLALCSLLYHYLKYGGKTQ